MSNVKRSISMPKLPSVQFPRRAASFLDGTTERISATSDASKVTARKRRVKEPADISRDVLSQSLALTDLIFGIYAIELWHYDENSGKLINVNLGHHQDEETGHSSGLLIKRRTQETDPTNAYANTDADDAFSMLTDPSDKDFLAPRPTPAGVGIVGVLWSASSSTHHHNVLDSSGRGHGLHIGDMFRSHDSRRARMHFGSGSRSNDSKRSRFGLDLRGSQSHHEKRTGVRILPRGNSGKWFHKNNDMLWRDVEELSKDPDQPYDERLQAFAKAGFKLASGVQFDINGYRGIVIYFGNPHADPQKLRNPVNSRLMENAAQLLGTAAAIQHQMSDVKSFREGITHHNWRRLKVKILAVVRFKGPLWRKNEGQVDTVIDTSTTSRRSSFNLIREGSGRSLNEAKETLHEAHNALVSRLARWTKKIQGGNAGIPPSFGYRQCIWTFVGVMTTHTILSRINQLVEVESDGELSLVLAPLGALTTLQYNLTAAPASQPRNAVFAQIFAITTAILLNYIPNIEPWFRSALAPAIVIPGMAKLGIIHPPAGASAIVFASGKASWEHFGIFLSGVVISIITAVLINNMSDKRQYPTSWYLANKAKRKFAKN